MARKPTFDLGGILDDTTSAPEPAAQRGSEPVKAAGQGPSRRLSLVLDAEVYAALRQRAFDESSSHQAICEMAVRKFLGIK